MAVRPRLRNPTELFQRMRPRWEAAGFTNFNERDTKIRAITQPVIEELLTLSEENQRAFLDLQTGTATGRRLDDIGNALGVRRQESAFASVEAIESSLAFFVTTGNFGDINSGADINLPASTLIWSAENENDSEERVTFRLDQAVTLQAGESISFVSATATADGPIGNVGAQVLRTHDFTSYTDAAGGGLRVINFFPILNGSRRESDDRYRARLLAYYRSMLTTNFDAIQLASLGVPGVRTTRLDRGYFGIGTGAVFVNGPESRSNSRMVSAVQQQILHSVPPGGDLQALPMVEVSVDVELAVKSTRALSSARQQQITSLLRSVLLQYLRESQLSGFVNMAEYQARAVAELSRTGVNISRQSFFDRIYISRSYGGSSSDERDLLTGTSFTLDTNEYPALGTFSVRYE